MQFHDYTDNLYREIFQPTEAVMQRVSLVEKELGENSIGLHIRRTDNKESIRCSTDALFFNVIDQTLRNDPSVKFYLATDSQETKRIFQEKYPQNIVVNPAKAARDTKDGIITAMVEMILLSRTKKIFGSYYSSYSEAAALLGNVPLQQLCKPTE